MARVGGRAAGSAPAGSPDGPPAPEPETPRGPTGGAAATARAIAPSMLAAALFLAALNLRPAVASVSPLLDTIRDADDLSHTAGGLLTTIPTLCMGAGAFLVPPVAARLGAERALTYAMVVIGVATAARIWGGNTTVLFATTLAIGAGIALAQPLLPGLVRTYFAKRSMLITALYSLGITLGAAIPAAASPAINNLTNSWEVALAFWAVFAVAAIVVLVPIARRSRPGPRRGIVTPPWRERRAWQISLFYGGASGLYWVVLAWLAPVYEDHGWSDTKAGLLLTLLSVAQAAATIAVTVRASRIHDRRPALILSLVIMAVGMAGVAASPFSVPVVWALLLGLGNGLVFPVMLVLPVDYGRDPTHAARLAAMGFGIGYLLASLGPLLTGALRDLTGSYALPFALYGGVSLLLILIAVQFAPQPAAEPVHA
jgi:MFS transporter, CP family, cyanate transporter